MSQQKILIYDGNGGQFRAGLGPWNSLADWKQQALLQQDPAAKSKVKSLDEVFAGLEAEWEEVSTYEECLARIGDVQTLVVFKAQVDVQLLNNAKHLTDIHALGYHSSLIDEDETARRGINLYYYPVTNFLAVAEHTLALILNFVKRLPDADNAVRHGTSWMVLPGNVRLMSDITVGVLGSGEIGVEVARLLYPFGTRILYHDLHKNPQLEKVTGATYVSWQQLFQESDFVTVHLPLNSHTANSIGSSEFGWMKHDAVFINTARGEIVDEPALIAALQTDQIAGAGLDVFQREPLPINHSLTHFENVILSPHTAWAGPWTLVHDALRVFTGVADCLRQK